MDTSSLSGNSATLGGGIYTANILTVTNSTLSSNLSTYGGGWGILLIGSVSIGNTTFMNNNADDGAGFGTGGGYQINDGMAKYSRA